MKKFLKFLLYITTVIIVFGTIFGYFRRISDLEMPSVDEEGIGIKNGEYISKLGLPHVSDQSLKSGEDGRSIGGEINLSLESYGKSMGLITVQEKEKNPIDGAVITDIMYLSLFRERKEDTVNYGNLERTEIIEKLRFKVEYSKRIIYRKKNDTFYVKDGSIELSAPFMSIGDTDDSGKTVVVKYNPKISERFDYHRTMVEEIQYESTYEEQVELRGAPIKEASVDFGEYKLSYKGDYAELQVSFYSQVDDINTKVKFIFDDEKYGNFERSFD